MDETRETPSPAPGAYHVHGSVSAGGEAELDLAARQVGVDARWGEVATGDPGPADLLGGAFSACMLKNLARAGSLLAFEYDGAELDVTLHRQDTPPRFTHIEYTMRIATEESDRRLELLHTNLRKYGTVFNTLAAVCEVTGTVSRMTVTASSATTDPAGGGAATD